MFFGAALIVSGWVVVGWDKTSYLGQAEIASFSSQDLSQRNKQDSFWLIASTGCFYVLFLWAMVVSDFLLLEFYKHLVLPCLVPLLQQTAEQITISKDIFVCFNISQYEINFFLEYTLRYFIFKFDLNEKHCLFSNRNPDL